MAIIADFILTVLFLLGMLTLFCGIAVMAAIPNVKKMW